MSELEQLREEVAKYQAEVAALKAERDEAQKKLHLRMNEYIEHVHNISVQRDEAREESRRLAVAIKDASNALKWYCSDTYENCITFPLEKMENAMKLAGAWLPAEPKESAPESPRYDSTTAKRVRAKEGAGHE